MTADASAGLFELTERCRGARATHAADGSSQNIDCRGHEQLHISSDARRGRLSP